MNIKLVPVAFADRNQARCVRQENRLCLFKHIRFLPDDLDGQAGTTGHIKYEVAHHPGDTGSLQIRSKESSPGIPEKVAHDALDKKAIRIAEDSLVAAGGCSFTGSHDLLETVEGLQTRKYPARGKPGPAEMRAYSPGGIMNSWGPWTRVKEACWLSFTGKVSTSLLATRDDDLQNPAPLPGKAARLVEQQGAFGRGDSKHLASMLKTRHVAVPQGRLVIDEGYGLEKTVTILQTTIQNRKAFTALAIDQQGLVLKAFENECAVGSTETEGVRESNINLHFTCTVRHVI